MTDGTDRFSVSRTFSEAMAILSARWKAMLGTTILMVVLMVAVYGLFAWPLLEAMISNPLGYQYMITPSQVGLAMLGGLVAMVVAVWLLVALLKIALERDAPRGIVASLAGALPRVPAAIGIAFCILVVMIALYIAFAIVGAILTFIAMMMGETAGGVLLILLVCGLLFGIIYVMLGWVAAYPAMVAEGLGPIQSLARSWRLVRGNRLRLVALWVLTYIAVIILTLIVMMLTLPGFLAAMSGDPAALEAAPPSTTAMAIFFIVNAVINIGVNLFFACLFAATYRNLARSVDGGTSGATVTTGG